jgi:hypothetical protein
MIVRLAPKLDDIHVTLDSHRLVDIAHPIWWRDSSGANPDPFTSGRWSTYGPWRPVGATHTASGPHTV